MLGLKESGRPAPNRAKGKVFLLRRCAVRALFASLQVRPGAQLAAWPHTAAKRSATSLRRFRSVQVMISATFGDEMWNTEGVGMTQDGSAFECQQTP